MNFYTYRLRCVLEDLGRKVRDLLANPVIRRRVFAYLVPLIITAAAKVGEWLGAPIALDPTWVELVLTSLLIGGTVHGTQRRKAKKAQG